MIGTRVYVHLSFLNTVLLQFDTQQFLFFIFDFGWTFLSYSGVTIDISSGTTGKHVCRFGWYLIRTGRYCFDANDNARFILYS